MSQANEYHGTLHGNHIELDCAPAFPDGQLVSVSIKPILKSSEADSKRDKLLKAFGAWANEAEQLDEYLEQNRQMRKSTRDEAIQ